MKKTIKTMIFAGVIVAGAFLYAHIAKVHNIYNQEVDPSVYSNTGVLTNLGVQQEFVSEEEYLDGVRIKSTIFTTAESTVIRYSLKNLTTGELAAEGTAEGSTIKNSKFFELPFDRVEGCRGTRFEFSVYTDSALGETAGVGFSCEPYTEEGTRLTVAGKEVENGTLVLKTVTNRFDFETFFVLLVFVLYVVLFMRFLYNLFK